MGQQPMGEQSDCAVAIVGGGPVALALALLLARRGIEVAAFEAQPALSQDLRASTFHPPTLDMLDTLGLGAPLVAQGLKCPHWQVRHHPSGERAVFDLGVLAEETAHPYRLQAEQWKLSRLLLAALEAEPLARVAFGRRGVALEQDEAGASVTFEASDGTRETVRARLVVGADGARSFVRQALALPFDGQTYPETTILATTTFPFEAHLEGLSNVSYCWKAGGNFSLLKVPGRWRVSIYPREDMPVEAQSTPEALNDAMQEIVPRAEPYDVMENRPYRVHQRIVPRYRVGRVALAGDAAHLNSPAGGMGLNGGLHDAFALADAVGAIVQDGAGLDRLDLYDRQRRPVAAEQILAQADRNRARMRERDPEKRLEILRGLQAITQDRARLKAHLLRASMIEGLRLSAAAA
jgi:2-polyprenyl-6-methoxyphenol hydroxylase-like FAD-dependent oxidoreductase